MSDIWKAISAPLDKGTIDWRIDGRPTNGQARFVAYIDSHTVRERLDSVVPGGWSSHLDREADAADKDGVAVYVYHCSITVGRGEESVTREDVGEGDTPKTAATDAFKRAAVRLGIGAELYGLGPNWVPVDEKGRPQVDPQLHYEAKQAGGKGAPVTLAQATKILDLEPVREAATAKPAAAPTGDVPACKKCGGPCWDNRNSKTKDTQPDFKCRDKACGEAIWLKKATPAKVATPSAGSKPWEDVDSDDSSLPF